MIMDTMGMVDTLAYKLLATYRFPIDRDDLKSVGYVALVEAAFSVVAHADPRKSGRLAGGRMSEN